MTVMASPLLETKFYFPRLRRGLVPRPRLSGRLNSGAQSKLTLVSAPPGFGKTTLLAEWLAPNTLGADLHHAATGAATAAGPSDEHRVAWLSLDQRDNHPTSFWTYLITALQTVAPGVGASAISLLQSPRPPPIETVLAPLLNELSAISNDIVLVLDDYHVVDAHDV
jgi:LuxR family transcriptional regulator, maltose regulon positive regulatory protein